MQGLSLIFLSPLGALVALSVLVLFVALALVARRASRLRAALGVSRAPRSRLAAPAVAAAVLAGLVGLAAAQPVAVDETRLEVRQDAEVYVVLDVSRSMLARSGPSASTRLRRAKDAAFVLRASLPGVPVGVVSLTDRVLPHLFPSADEDAFRATVDLAIGIERPPPRSSFLTTATSFDSLASLSTRRFFTATAPRQLVVVFTDGESQSVNVARIARAFARPPGMEAVFVQMWDADERVYTRGVPEPQYRPDPRAREVLEALASAVDGSVFGEDEVGEAARDVRVRLDEGPTVTEGLRRERTALAPYVLLVAVLPLGVLLWRRDR